MKNLSIIFYLLLTINVTAMADEDKSCNFFLIKEHNDEVVIEKIIIKDNEMKVIKDEGIISCVMAFDPGSKSGALVERDNRVTAYIAHYANDKLNISYLKGDGTKREMPSIDIENAENIIIRLNITGANGYRKAYRIENYDTIIEDHGPILNMFKDIGLNQGDYSLLTESLEGKAIELLEGFSPYDFVRNWITVECILSNNTSGKFVVDFGATTTVVNKQALTADIEISNFQLVKYSANGKKVSKAVVPGATGMVNNIAGVTNLAEFRFGDIVLNDLKVTVLDDFPKPFVENEIIGIIGMDILQKANLITISNLNNPGAKHEIIFSSSSIAKQECDYSNPYTMAGGHIFIDGSIGNKPVSFLLDTGSGISGIGNEFVKNNEIKYDLISNEKKTLMGLDGTATEYSVVSIDNINIHSVKLQSLTFLLSDTFVFETLGLQDEAVLLGVDFLMNFRDVSFDLSNNNLMLWK